MLEEVRSVTLKRFIRNIAIVCGLSISLGTEGRACAEEVQLSSKSYSGPKASSILVVEDELLVRLMVSDFLREAGLSVIEAISADEAVEILLSDASIDLILTDVRMPGSMDGLQLLDYAKSRFPNLPVIVTSGHLLPRDAIARGAAQFLGKPYSFEDAIALVQLELAKAL